MREKKQKQTKHQKVSPMYCKKHWYLKPTVQLQISKSWPSFLNQGQICSLKYQVYFQKNILREKDTLESLLIGFDIFDLHY